MLGKVILSLLLLAAPAAALDTEEQHRAGAEVLELAAEQGGYSQQFKDAVRSLAKGRDGDSRRWAMCWCFEQGGRRRIAPLGPEHPPGCHWLASFAHEADLSKAERDTVRYCAERP